jgi:hypothetical protein
MIASEIGVRIDSDMPGHCLGRDLKVTGGPVLLKYFRCELLDGAASKRRALKSRDHA